ncbi:MAG: YbaK/EbsC family protein [Candidatus Thiodiazotropha sp. (ex Gloverina cf. vestifex)]|nr:YbaK/EbsC family protein [Candidatus Thiodiazotropha sp. (ex Gloverina cf. vestifex)]
MAIAITLKEYLRNHDLDYEEIDHRPTDSALMSSEAARIPGDRMAKSVLLGDDERYLLAVIPATHRFRLDHVARLTGRKFTLISEDELEDAFSDCEPGAVPPHRHVLRHRNAGRLKPAHASPYLPHGGRGRNRGRDRHTPIAISVRHRAICFRTGSGLTLRLQNPERCPSG